MRCNQETAALLGTPLREMTEREITEISVDSRSVTRPEGTLFFALKGVNHDAHDYIPALYGRGEIGRAHV